jgi:UDP-glucuronate 4-epimerase
VYNQGDMQRDFTFIDDIVAGVLQSLDAPPARTPANKNHTPASSDAPYRVLNIGNAKPVHLMEFIETLERHWGRVAEKNYLPMQPGDVPITYADASKLTALTGYQPATSIDDGVMELVNWYKQYLKVK